MRQPVREYTELLPYSVIEKAINGNPDALICVVEHYNSFTNYKCQRKIVDENGYQQNYVDPDHKRNVEFALMKAIPKFKL